MKNTKRLSFKEIEDKIPNPLVTSLKGIYTDMYNPLLNKSSSLEEYLSMLNKNYPNLNADEMLNDMDSLTEEEMEEVLSVYEEQKSKIDLSEDYKLEPVKNLHKSKEVQSAYKKAMKGVDSSDNWNEISNGAEEERKHYFKLHPELRKDEKKESLSSFLHKKLTVSIKEAKQIEFAIKNYMRMRKK